MPLPKKRFGHASPLRKAIEGFGLGLVFALLGIGLQSSQTLDLLENKTWDLRVATFAKPSPATDQIRMIFLDQASLDWAKNENEIGWPWPRELYAKVLQFLNRAGAKAVVFDVFYSEHSTVDDDQLFGTEIKNNGRFVEAIFLSHDEKAKAWPWPQNVVKQTFSFQGQSNLKNAANANGATFPIPEVAAPSSILANTLGTPDSDGIYRRANIMTEYLGREVPSLGVGAYILGQGVRKVAYEPGILRFENKDVPVDEQAGLLLRYRGPSQTHKTFSVRAVIASQINWESGEKKEGDLDPADFKDKYVFFGFTAPGLYDLRPTPLSPSYPGVEVNATTLDNLLAGDFLRPVPKEWTWTLIALLSIAGGVLIRLSRKAWHTVVVFVGFLSLPVALGWLLYEPGYWLPIVAPETTVLLSLIGGFVVNYAGEGRQKKFIKDAFSQYLSPVVIDQLVQNPELLILGGEKRELSILFSDIRGFTSISEKLDPVELTALLNEYLSEMTTIIYNYGGTIDKYEGDAIIAFWNAPLDLADHARKAVKASLEYQRRLAEIRPRLKEMSGGAEVYTRVGINSGPVVIGNMGSEQRFNYTFFGDAGNLASRLEGMNKQFGTYLMIAQRTRDLAGEDPEVAYREVSRVAVVGKSEPVTVYEPMFKTEADAKAETLAKFAQGLALYYEGKFSESLKIMESIAEVDPPAAHYVPKLKELLEKPPASWKGVWVSTEK